MFVKESLKRPWKVKPDYIVAAEAALGVGIATKRQTLSAALRTRIRQSGGDKQKLLESNYQQNNFFPMLLFFVFHSQHFLFVPWRYIT